MRYPGKEEYLAAVQRRESFGRGPLARAEFVPHPIWRIPKPAAGASAVVFRAVVDGENLALRFPTRADASHRDRYDALREHFLGHGLGDCVALPSWEDDAIEINGRLWPVVRMQWVNGRNLNQYVEQLVEERNTAALAELAGAWRRLVDRLQRAGFAHGDLQHGNVMVDDRGALRLVDFDRAWILRFTGQAPPVETGHRNYQPDGPVWGQWMDTFPGLVVYTSLIALSKNPDPWSTFHTGENLLFREDDFRPPFGTPVWPALAGIQDADLNRLTARLRGCCVPGGPAGPLEPLLTEAVPWWERTGRQPESAIPMPAPAAPEAKGSVLVDGPSVPTPSGEPWWEDVERTRRPAARTTRTSRQTRRMRPEVAVAVAILVAVLVLLLSANLR